MLREKMQESKEIQQALVDSFLVKFNSPEMLRAWVHTYLDIDLPIGWIDPDSNSSPVDWMYEAYRIYRDNLGDKQPGFIVVSSRDSYKCVKKGTFMRKKDGFLCPIESIKIGDEIWSGKNWRKVTNWIDDGTKASKTITTENGWKLTGSPIHRVWGIKLGDSLPSWIKSSDLQVGDSVAINYPEQPEFTKNQEEYDAGYLLGLLQGDGCTTCWDKYGLTILTCENKKIIKAWDDFCFKTCGRLPKPGQGKRFRDRTISSRPLIEALKSYGLTSSYSWEKEIPQYCLESKSAFLGFIAGLFDTDGSWAAGMAFPLTATKMLEQLQVGLLGMGVYSSLNRRINLVGNQKHPHSVLTVPYREFDKLIAMGLELNVNKISIQKNTQSIPDAHDVVPQATALQLYDVLPSRPPRKFHGVYLKPKIGRHRITSYDGLNRSKYSSLVDWAKNIEADLDFKTLDSIQDSRWKKVTKIEDGEDHFFDLTVEEDHSYWSDGFISHNTLSESLLNVILMAHFGASIAHMAAIESQAKKAVEYISGSLRKLKPYLEAHGMVLDAENKRELVVMDSAGHKSYTLVIIATVAGANSAHTNILSLDELDVMRDPRALEEAKLGIPSQIKGQHPLTIKTSTLKYSYGLMQQEIDNKEISGDMFLKWNVLDITEYCDPSRHQPDRLKVERYIHPNLPLSNISPTEHKGLSDKKQAEYEKITAHAGCATCKLLPVCKMRLSQRPVTDVGGLYKTIDYVIGKFKSTSPDMAEAQMLCRKPSQSGLVYPRYSTAEDAGNTITLSQAYEQLTGEKASVNVSLSYVIGALKKGGYPIYAGVDWGFRHLYTIGVSTIVRNEWWQLDTVAVAGLEFDDMLKEALRIRDIYRPQMWFADTAEPMFIKTFNNKGMRCKKFTKDVMGGIEAVRTQIQDAQGVRRLKVLLHDNNAIMDKMFKKHAFKLDAQGKPTQVPDDGEYADVADQLRYQAQNLFKVKTNAEMYNHPVGLDGKLMRDPEQYKAWNSQTAEAALFPSASNDPLDPANPFSHILIQAHRGEDE
jgi:intein/homing endonuclease